MPPTDDLAVLAQPRAAHRPPLKERAVVARRLQSGFARALGDPSGGAHLVERARLAAAHRVAAHREDVAPNVGLRDRVERRRDRRRRVDADDDDAVDAGVPVDEQPAATDCGENDDRTRACDQISSEVRAPTRARMMDLMPPRMLKSPTTSIHRGFVTFETSSRMRFTARS